MLIYKRLYVLFVCPNFIFGCDYEEICVDDVCVGENTDAPTAFPTDVLTNAPTETGSGGDDVLDEDILLVVAIILAVILVLLLVVLIFLLFKCCTATPAVQLEDVGKVGPHYVNGANY